MNQSGNQEQKKDQQQGEGQGDQQDKKEQQDKEGAQPQQPKKTEDQKALERQLNALKQNEKDIQKEREKMIMPVPRQSMDKDW